MTDVFTSLYIVRELARKAEFVEQEHPRGGHGRFTDKPGGSSPTAPRAPHHGAQVASELTRQLTERGGFSYQARLSTSPTDGYMVSPYKGREFKIPGKGMTDTDLVRYALRNKDLLKKADHYLGGWYNPEDNNTYLDVSIRVPDLKDAFRFAGENNQEAIYDIKLGLEGKDGTLYTRDAAQHIAEREKESATKSSQRQKSARVQRMDQRNNRRAWRQERRYG